jgi:hypothetical protein
VLYVFVTVSQDGKRSKFVVFDAETGRKTDEAGN